MKDTYVHALLELIEAGTPVETVLSNLKRVLVRRGHMKLHSAILTSLATKIEIATSAKVSKVVVAHAGSVSESDIKKALAQLSAPVEHYAVIVNPNIIGGLIATYQSKQLDQSYQTKLRELYQSIITS